MNVVEILVTACALGAASATHCLGMCGVFVVTATARRAGTGRPTPRLAQFFAGKLVTYGLIGALAGWFGMVVVQTAKGATAWLGLAVAATLCAAGIAMLRGTTLGGSLRVARLLPLGRYLSALFAHLRPRTPFGWGLLSSLLPCGVVYLAALQSAAQGDPLAAILFMLAFGASTAPALSVLAVLGARLEPGERTRRWRRLSAFLLLGLGAWMCLRSLPALVSASDPASCCH